MLNVCLLYSKTEPSRGKEAARKERAPGFPCQSQSDEMRRMPHLGIRFDKRGLCHVQERRFRHGLGAHGGKYC